MTNTQTTTPITRTETGSQLVAALETVWATIRQHHPEVPDVVIITGSGNEGLGLVWGHYGHDFWRNGRFRVNGEGVVERDRKPELFVSGQTLGVGAVKTVQTMLHEASHAVAAARGVKDTSRQNRYHNRRFREIAEELGLAYEYERPHDVLGFSQVTITEVTRQKYAAVIAQLDEAIALSMELPAWLKLTGGQGGTGQGDPGEGGDGVHGRRRPRDPGRKSTALLKATCGCDRIIRISRSVLEQAPITCGQCGDDFTAA